MPETEHKPLPQQLINTVNHFRTRNSVGVMTTEHSVFIPAPMMRDKSQETEEFVTIAKKINKNEKLNLPVKTEEHEGLLMGVEFVFSFNEDTDFDGVIEVIRDNMSV